MRLREAFGARGHPHIRASHKTTLMVTTEPALTPRGDCIVAVGAERGPRDLSPEVKDAVRNANARIRLAIEAAGLTFTVTGRGDPRLGLCHPTDIVTRKSRYICDRTLMIGADKASNDLPSPLLRLLQNSQQEVRVILQIDLEDDQT